MNSLQYRVNVDFSWTFIIIIVMLSNTSLYTQPIDSAFLVKEVNRLQELYTDGKDTFCELISDSILTVHDADLHAYPTLATKVYLINFNSKLRLHGRSDARNSWLSGIETLKLHQPKYNEELARMYMAYAVSFNADIQTDSILAYLNQAEELLESTNAKSRALISLYYQKGRIAYNYSDYAGQISYSIKGLTQQAKYFPENHLMRIVFCNAIGIGYRNMADLVNAEKYFALGLQTPATTPPERSMHASIYNNLGLVYQGKKDYKKCIECISKAIDYYKTYISPTDLEIGSGYDNLGQCHAELGQFYESEYYFRKALSFMQKNLPDNHRDLILPHLSLGSLKLSNQELDSAEYYFLRAKQIIVSNGWSREDPDGDFILEDPFEVFSHIVHLRKRQYEITRDTTYLNEALSTMEDFISTTNFAVEQYNSTASIENYFRAYEPTFANALECLYKKQELTGEQTSPKIGLRWIEQFKTMELRHAFQRAKVQFIGEYSELNKRQNQLKDSIRLFENVIAETEIPSDSIQDILNQAKFKFQNWKAEVRNTNPNYYKLIYGLDDTSFDFDALLSNEETIIVYKLGNQCIYSFVVNHDKLKLFRLPITDTFYNAILSWRNAIKEYGTSSKYNEAHLDRLLALNYHHGRTFYQSLFNPIHSRLRDKLIIIPDGILGYIPFGALITKDTEDRFDLKQYPFLIKQHSLTFSYSLTAYRDMIQKQIHPTLTMLAIAPAYASTDQNGFQPLDFNVLEAQTVTDLFNGTLLSRTDATRQEFISTCGEFKMIHLAAHGRSNEGDGNRSFLLFSTEENNSDRLYTGDIYNLKLNAEFVSLSACETGLGSIQKGEGIMSLARAFSFAGANSVMSSLWNINDKSTAKIMSMFYTQLKKGIAKDISMQAAIGNYLQSSTQSEAHPYYWSAFITMGDPRPISISQTNYTWVVLFISLTVILFIFHKSFNLLGTRI